MLLRTCYLGAVCLLAQALPSGCLLPGGTTTNPSTDVFNISITAPENANVGDTVLLAAAPTDDSTVSDATYTWYQTYGRAVWLQDVNSDTAMFPAPSVSSDQTVRFRVDARSISTGLLASAEVSLVLLTDPNSVIASDPNNSDPFPQVKLTTSKGDIVLELNRDKAPLSVNNFLRYVDEGFYDNTIFHRVIPDFVVQGGGFDPNFVQKDTHAPIKLESDNGLKNARATLAMARTNDPDSATSQFYVNLKDNTDLDRTATNPGYAVFGKVISGMDVIDAIAALPTGSSHGMSDVPTDNVILTKAERVKSGGGDVSGSSIGGFSGGTVGGTKETTTGTP